MFERAAQYDPGNSMLFVDLATTYSWAGRNDNVQPPLERALALNPGNENAARLLGHFLISQRGDVEGARGVLSGRGPSAQINGSTYWLTRDYEEAIRLIEQLPEDSPAFGPTRDKGRIARTLPALRRSEQRARPIAGTAARPTMALLADSTHSTRAFAFIAIGLARIELAFGDRDAAVQLAERGAQSDAVIRDTIFRAYYRSYLAEIYALAGRNDEAIALISELLKSRSAFTTLPRSCCASIRLGPAPR